MIQGDGPDRNYRHRNKHKVYGDEAEAEKYNRDELHWWIDHLFDLMEETDPETYPDATGKDRKAVLALQGMSIVSEFLTGWAMDHVVGLAMLGRTPFPNMPDNLERTEEQQEAFDSANSHEHERRASLHFRKRLSDSGLDGEKQRLVVQMLLRCRTPRLPYALRMEILDALKATTHGVTKPFFDVHASGLGLDGYSRRHLQMKALQHVAFRVACGQTKTFARDLVAGDYEIEPDTLRKWEGPLRNFFSTLEVDRLLASATNGGLATTKDRKSKKERIEEERIARENGFEIAPRINHFSDDILAEDGRQYIALNGT